MFTNSFGPYIFLFYYVNGNNPVPFFVQSNYDFLAMYIRDVFCRKGDVLFF